MNWRNKLMVKSLYFLFGLILLFGPVLFANIINVPDDYPTIQEGINAAIDADTVLVYPGIYYENIDFNGKNITVSSLYITTEVDSFIHQTIIDGNQNGSVVKAVSGESSSTLLCGFTIQNGSGTYYNRFILGGGIYTNDSDINISSCIIENNFAGYGGGVMCAAFSHTYCYPRLKSCTIRRNHAIKGGGIFISTYTFSFSQEELCNIYLNTAGSGNDIFGPGPASNPVAVYIDTFTVAEPDIFFFRDYGNSTFQCLNAKITP